MKHAAKIWEVLLHSSTHDVGLVRMSNGLYCVCASPVKGHEATGKLYSGMSIVAARKKFNDLVEGK